VQLLVLPGNHPSIRAWAERVAQTLARNFERTRVHDYEHWETGQERIDFERELDRLPPVGAHTLVLGKSAGAALALLAIDRQRIAPERLVLIGLPLRFARAVHVDLAGPICRLSVPTLLIQQSSDPGAPFTEAAEFAAPCKTCKAVEVAGDDHLYNDIDEWAHVVETWMSISS
jgi:pimeloyl-ACP methyl ester carboxylesterase